MELLIHPIEPTRGPETTPPVAGEVITAVDSATVDTRAPNAPAPALDTAPIPETLLVTSLETEPAAAVETPAFDPSTIEMPTKTEPVSMAEPVTTNEFSAFEMAATGAPAFEPDPQPLPAASTAASVTAVPELTSFYAPTPSESDVTDAAQDPSEVEAPVTLISDLPPLPVQDAPEPATAAPAEPALHAPLPAELPVASTEPAADTFLAELMPHEAEPATDLALAETLNPAAKETSELPPGLDDDVPIDPNMPNVDQMKLEEPANETQEQAQPGLTNIGKNVAIVGVLLIAGLLLKFNSGTLGTQKVKSKGYTYSFKFYRHSKTFAYGDGSAGLKHETDETTGSIKLTPTSDLLTCTQVGNGWKSVFKATMNKTEVPVCTPDGKTYMAVFPGPDHRQLFTVTYNTVQKSDVYPELKAIFSSVSVKK